MSNNRKREIADRILYKLINEINETREDRQVPPSSSRSPLIIPLDSRRNYDSLFIKSKPPRTITS